MAIVARGSEAELADPWLVMGRTTQGVKIFNIDKKSHVVSVERIFESEGEEE